jgi:hypothetical protein
VPGFPSAIRVFALTHSRRNVVQRYPWLISVSLGVMRPFRVILALLSFVVADSARCADERNALDEEFLRGFMAGDYDLIGRKPDSTTTYTGRVTLRADGNSLQAVRIIDGKTTQGTIRFDTVAGADRIQSYGFASRSMAWSMRLSTVGNPTPTITLASQAFFTARTTKPRQQDLKRFSQSTNDA